MGSFDTEAPLLCCHHIIISFMYIFSDSRLLSATCILMTYLLMAHLTATIMLFLLTLVYKKKSVKEYIGIGNYQTLGDVKCFYISV